MIERWAAMLPDPSVRLLSRIKVTMATYLALAETSRTRGDGYDAPTWQRTQRFDAVPVVIDDEIDAPWIAYDQHGDEMGRGEWIGLGL